MMEESRIVSSAWRTYFVVDSKEGFATLGIDHPAGHQRLTLPVYPNDAVQEAAHLLEPVFAHYALQWSKIMVDDPNQTDARGFYLEAPAAAGRIADPANTYELTRIGWSHLPEEIRHFLNDDISYAPALSDSRNVLSDVLNSNLNEFCVPAEEAGIEPYQP